MNNSVKLLLTTHLKDLNLRVIGIDPGETTGICCFRGGSLIDAQQLDTSDPVIGPTEVEQYIRDIISLTDKLPLHIVMEDYKVYSWKADDHSWASLHTPRLIGAIEYICGAVLKVPITKQMAQVAKGFCTDEKLKAWNLWVPGKRHARDAIRHAIYYMLFEVAKIQQRT